MPQVFQSCSVRCPEPEHEDFIENIFRRKAFPFSDFNDIRAAVGGYIGEVPLPVPSDERMSSRAKAQIRDSFPVRRVVAGTVILKMFLIVGGRGFKAEV